MSIVCIISPSIHPTIQQWFETLQQEIQNRTKFHEIKQRFELYHTEENIPTFLQQRLHPPVQYPIRFLLSDSLSFIQWVRKKSPSTFCWYIYHSKYTYPIDDKLFTDNTDNEKRDSSNSICQSILPKLRPIDIQSYSSSSIHELIEYLQRNSHDIQLKNDKLYIILGTYRQGWITFVMNLEYLIETKWNIDMELGYLEYHGLQYVVISFLFGEMDDFYLNQVKNVAASMSLSLVKGYPTCNQQMDFPIQYPECFTVEHQVHYSKEQPYIHKTSSQLVDEWNEEIEQIQESKDIRTDT